MAQGSFIQRLILEIEGGSLAVWIQRTVLLALVVAVTVVVLTYKFQNFGNDTGFDQAQLARQISKGEGYSTQVARPLQLWFMEKSGRVYDPSKLPELVQGPAYPFFNSLIFNFFKKDYMARAKGEQFLVDRAVVLGAIVLFLIALGALYATGTKLFDSSLALLTVGLCLVCNLFWDFAQSCLPQLLLLMFFSLLLLCLAMALREEYKEEGTRRTFPWIIPLGFLAGLMTLTHGLASWIAVGLLVSVLIFFRGRWLYGAVVLATFSAVIAPWLIRNYQVCGNPLGMAHYSFLDGVIHPMELWQSMFEPDFKQVTIGPIQKKLVFEAVAQIRNVFENMGFSLVAPLFFISLLHPFRRRDTGALRWALLVMFAFTFLGMCLFTSNAKGVSADNLHLVFMPFFTLYGMAFVVISWNRGMPSIPILRYTAVAVLFIISGLSTIAMLATSTNQLKNFPPYLPSVMRVGAEVARPGESLSADVPECVAYSTDRLTLKMPYDFNKFVDAIDYKALRKPIVALILTPRTGDAKFISEVAFGRYSRWAKFVMRHRELDLQGFPLNKMALLPPGYSNVMFIDSERYAEIQAQGKVPQETNKAALPKESPVVPIPEGQGETSATPPSGEVPTIPVPANKAP
jgi:hypothetical protein